ncbi:MAG: glycosyltransferase [Chloroflexi bacterium]|nr:glycosyltransferase [Chloroflexota bacterium]
MVRKNNYAEQSQKRYQQKRIAHWNKVAVQLDNWKSLGVYYHERLNQIYRSLIPQETKLLEIGCGRGELLGALQPSFGVGIDFSSEMISRAKESYPELTFYEVDVLEFDSDQKFDFIIFSDVISDLWDVQGALEVVASNATSRTRIIINFYSRLWEGILRLTRKLKLTTQILEQNWFTFEDVSNLLNLADYEVIKHQKEILFPFAPTFFANFINKYVVKVWPFNHLALINIVVARPKPNPIESDNPPIVSVIVPARNEEGNIKNIISRVPQMGGGTELIFVEGHSKDKTFEEIQNQIKANPGLNCKLYKQTGVGKGDAVRLGFKKASGEVLIILDADLTVPPEDLPRFYEALVSGKGDLINGVRLVYPLEEKAMRPLNFLGNKFFSLAFSWLLDQPIKDTLCGTKVLYKHDYQRIAENRPYFGEFDPFGDFDLLFNAAKLGMKIIDIPVRYRERVYGETNIDRWRHGWLLLSMAVVAARKLKFT